jgi:hypothetical protein
VMNPRFISALFLLTLPVCPAGEISEVRLLSSQQVEITFSSREGSLYDIHESKDLKRFSFLARVRGARGQTKAVVELAAERGTRRFFRVNSRQTPPTVSWQKSYSGSKEESHGHYIIACRDGGFLQVGETGFLPSTRILAVKVDAAGRLLWKRELSNRDTGGSSHGTYNLGNSVLETDDGYLIAGAINRNSAIIKLNKDTGQPVFVRIHGNGGYDAYEHLAQLGELIVAVGYTNAEDRNNTFFAEGRGYMAFLNPAGEKTGISLGDDLAQAYRVAARDGELIVSGLAWSEDDDLDFTVLKLDGSGNLIWKRSFGGSRDDHCFGMDLGVDGSIFLTGHTLSGTTNWQTYTMKLDSDGILQWENKRGNPRGFDARYIHDEAWGVRATPDGGCIITAGTGDEYEEYSERIGPERSDQWRVYMVKYGPEGTMEWQATYGAPEEDWAGEDLALTLDGGVIVAVDNAQFGFLKLPSY